MFPLSANAVKLAWRRLRQRAGAHGLRFHDLRHEAVSVFFEKGLSVPEVALISGHRDPRMLFRYTHLKVEDVAAELGWVRMGATRAVGYRADPIHAKGFEDLVLSPHNGHDGFHDRYHG